ncbi:uncharacterized protein K02A2.6-like, partial [Musca vetustissima]|uniref:uncharacterized protein K02A2.6-like n=1 Tax=Musca vetustissima TaxID=27455 RepID=UPI002AB69A94
MENEDFKEYASRVNLQCELFKLDNLTIDQFKCLIFILGLKSSQDSDIRIRLLRHLNESKEVVNLEKLVDETQSILDLKSDTALIEGSVKQCNNIGKPQQKQKLSKTACWYCGDMHYAKHWPYSKHKCTKCEQIGHKDGFCKNKQQQSKTNHDQHSKKNNHQNFNKNKGKFNAKTILSTKQVQFKELRKYVTVSINSKQVKLQVDTASDMTIISESTWKRIGRPEATPTKDTANVANAKQMKFLAKCSIEVSIGNRSEIVECYISDVESLNVMGIDWIEKFNLWNIPITAWCRQINFNDEISKIKASFKEVFDNSSMGLCTKTKVNIKVLPNVKEVFIPKRPVPYAARSEIETELQRLENLGIITPVDTSKWAAPIVVSKRNGKVRICGDYSTGLNIAIEPNQYPLPTPEEIFAECHNCTVFTHLDLSDAYLQTEVDDDSKELLTVNTHKGLFKFNRLPPGVKCAPGAFQRIMDQLCTGIDGVKAYIDDIMIASPDIEQHKQTLQTLLQRIQEFGFRLKFEKCAFFQSSIIYLGQIIDKTGIRPDPQKIKAVQQLKTPENISEVSFASKIDDLDKFVKKNNIGFSCLLTKNFSQTGANSLVRTKCALSHFAIIDLYDDENSGDGAYNGYNEVIEMLKNNIWSNVLTPSKGSHNLIPDSTNDELQEDDNDVEKQLNEFEDLLNSIQQFKVSFASKIDDLDIFVKKNNIGFSYLLTKNFSQTGANSLVRTKCALSHFAIIDLYDDENSGDGAYNGYNEVIEMLKNNIWSNVLTPSKGSHNLIPDITNDDLQEDYNDVENQLNEFEDLLNSIQQFKVTDEEVKETAVRRRLCPDPPEPDVQNLLEATNSIGDLVIGCDANAHHSETNPR